MTTTQNPNTDLHPGDLLAIQTVDPDDYRQLRDGTLEYVGLVHAAIVGYGLRCNAGQWSREFHWQPGTFDQITCPDCAEAVAVQAFIREGTLASA